MRKSFKEQLDAQGGGITLLISFLIGNAAGAVSDILNLPFKYKLVVFFIAAVIWFIILPHFARWVNKHRKDNNDE